MKNLTNNLHAFYAQNLHTECIYLNIVIVIHYTSIKMDMFGDFNEMKVLGNNMPKLCEWTSINPNVYIKICFFDEDLYSKDGKNVKKCNKI